MKVDAIKKKAAMKMLHAESTDKYDIDIRIADVMLTVDSDRGPRKIKREGYISLTDIAKIANPKNPDKVISNWLKKKSTIEYIFEWNRVFNFDFTNPVRPSPLGSEGGGRFSNRHGDTMNPRKLLEQCNDISIVSIPGSHEGTYADPLIAYDLCASISTAYKLTVYMCYQEYLKKMGDRGWFKPSRETLKAATNLFSDVIDEHLIFPPMSRAEANQVRADEFDMLNNIVYQGITAGMWRRLNPEKEGNIRDDEDYTGLYQHMMMQYLQIVDSTLIRKNFPYSMRQPILECEAHSLLQRWINAEESEDPETLMYADLSRFVGINESQDQRPLYQQIFLPAIQRKTMIGLRSGEYHMDKDGIYRNSEGFIELLARP